MKTVIILSSFVLFFIAGLTVMAIYMPKPDHSVDSKNFVGVDAAGFKHGSGSPSTIINH